eukprot:GFKZ01005837.1.p1 GENE.GFKZ01005837.1~~GFKZ01005837.1.p1  ORF type:complete len:336 (+),score=38.54 GFKZ01005837.1:77-1009(+)
MSTTSDRAANQSRLIREGFKPNPTHRPFQKQLVHRNPTAPFLPTAPRSRRHNLIPSDSRSPDPQSTDSRPTADLVVNSRNPRPTSADPWNTGADPSAPLVTPFTGDRHSLLLRPGFRAKSQPDNPPPASTEELVPTFIAQHPHYRRRREFPSPPRSSSRSPPRRRFFRRPPSPTHEAPASLLPRPAGPLSTDEDRENDGNWIQAVNNSKRSAKKPRLLTPHPIDVDAEFDSADVDDGSIVSLPANGVSKPGKENKLLNDQPIDVDAVEVIDVDDSEVELVSPIPTKAIDVPSDTPNGISKDAAATVSARG